MFEQPNGKSGNRALVALTLTDGSVQSLSLRLPLSSKLADALNNADLFLDVVAGDGAQFFLAKTDIRRVNLIDVPKANQLNLQRRNSDRTQFDPHTILGLTKPADTAAIKQAYHGLVRLYHPDRFANLELPKEMKDYAAAMLVRINLAYEQLSA